MAIARAFTFLCAFLKNPPFVLVQKYPLPANETSALNCGPQGLGISLDADGIS